MQGKVCSMSTKIKVTLISAILVIAMLAGSISVDAVSVGTTTGCVKAKKGLYLRASASDKGKKVIFLKNKTKVVILKEVFKTKNSTKSKKKWYYVSLGARKGYIRSDRINKIKYANTTVSTTARVKFRKGAGNKMKKKGAFAKGKVLTAVLEARARDGSTWYKIRRGRGFVYVSGKYLVNGTPAPAQPAANTVTAAAAQSGAPAPDPNAPLSLTVNNATTPDKAATYTPFFVKGTVVCNHLMETVEVGVKNSAGKWVIKASQDPNSTLFNLASVDAQLKFGSIPAGSYTYMVKVKVDGEWKTPLKQDFERYNSKIPAQITQTAINLAWPLGTSSALYKYSGGSASPNFQTAINTVFPDRSRWGKAPRLGASCDVFVGTTIRTSGYDTTYPRGWDEQYPYLANSDKWVKISYSGDLSSLRSGDIILYKRSSGGCHTCIYVNINGKSYLAEAQIEKYYGFINSSLGKVQKFSDKKVLVVYRAKY